MSDDDEADADDVPIDDSTSLLVVRELLQRHVAVLEDVRGLFPLLLRRHRWPRRPIPRELRHGARAKKLQATLANVEALFADMIGSAQTADLVLARLLESEEDEEWGH